MFVLSFLTADCEEMGDMGEMGGMGGMKRSVRRGGVRWAVGGIRLIGPIDCGAEGGGRCGGAF